MVDFKACPFKNRLPVSKESICWSRGLNAMCTLEFTHMQDNEVGFAFMKI